MQSMPPSLLERYWSVSYPVLVNRLWTNDSNAFGVRSRRAAGAAVRVHAQLRLPARGGRLAKEGDGAFAHPDGRLAGGLQLPDGEGLHGRGAERDLGGGLLGLAAQVDGRGTGAGDPGDLAAQAVIIPAFGGGLADRERHAERARRAEHRSAPDG